MQILSSGISAATPVAVTIDGSFLTKLAAPGGVLASRTVHRAAPFPIDFSKLDVALLAFASKSGFDRVGVGTRVFVTSIFDLPDDLEEWPRKHRFSDASIQTLRRCSFARERVAETASASGYVPRIFRPLLQPWMLQQLMAGTYREKLVDSEVVARTTEIALTQRDAVNIVLTGDADITPALRYSDRILLAAAEPGRGSPREWGDRGIFVIEQHAAKLMAGEYVWTCPRCSRIFATRNPIPGRSLIRCNSCRHR
jgi:DNA-directed RNA polymerase subunit RPC12/RpoP